MLIQLNPIAYAENSELNRKDENWGDVYSTIKLVEKYNGAFLGLEEFSHAIVISFLHQATFSIEKHLHRHPRNLSSMPLLGIFAQRGKNRPNPIGITAVKIASVKEESLLVKGLDVIDGTPILDIKPYFPQYDRIENPKVPDWVNQLMNGYF